MAVHSNGATAVSNALYVTYAGCVGGPGGGDIGGDDGSGLTRHARDLLTVDPAPVTSGGRVKLRFALGHSGRLRLAAYDIGGRNAGTVFDGTMGSGRHELSWTAPSLGQGVYFFRFAFEGQEKVLRVAMVR